MQVGQERKKSHAKGRPLESLGEERESGLGGQQGPRWKAGAEKAQKKVGAVCQPGGQVRGPLGRSAGEGRPGAQAQLLGIGHTVLMENGSWLHHFPLVGKSSNL